MKIRDDIKLFNNVPTGNIPKVLGHENRAATEIYLHSIGNAERIALDIYEAGRKSLTQIHTRSKIRG